MNDQKETVMPITKIPKIILDDCKMKIIEIIDNHKVSN